VKKIIPLMIMVIVGIMCLTGCKKNNENNAVNNGDVEGQEAVFKKPEKYEECESIHIGFDRESVHISTKEGLFNYNVSDEQGNTRYSRDSMNLNDFPNFKEFVMSSKVQDKLGKTTGSKYYIEFDMHNAYAVYSVDEKDEIFDELYKILKIDDTAIYGTLSKNLAEMDNIVNNLEYNYLINKTKDENEDESSNRWYNYTFLNTEKLQMYIVQYWNRSKEDNEAGFKDQLCVNVQSIEESELPLYTEQYTKEEAVKKLKNAVEEDTKEEYVISLTGM